MDEDRLRQIIREEVRAELLMIRMQLLAILQVTQAVPLKKEYILVADEESFPFKVLIDYARPRPERDAAQPSV